jgi:light-regulated signal transduction histidine kinase (bacteriophytochrome)
MHDLFIKSVTFPNRTNNQSDSGRFRIHYAAKLFQPFQHIHPGVDFDGSGVGLAATSRIGQRHGGEIWAEAASDQGATLFFTLSSISK